MTDKYILIPEIDNAGIFVCLSEIVILGKEILAENIKKAIYENEEIALINESNIKVYSLVINPLHNEILKDAVDIQEAALMIIDIEGQVIKEMDIEKQTS